MNVYLNKFMVYFEIHRLHREGFSIRQISKELAIDRKTVSRYLSMDEQGFERQLAAQSTRKRVLPPMRLSSGPVWRNSGILPQPRSMTG
jgi:IS30 family transposase